MKQKRLIKARDRNFKKIELIIMAMIILILSLNMDIRHLLSVEIYKICLVKQFSEK